MVWSRRGPRTGEAPPGAIATPPKAHVAQVVHDPLAGIPPAAQPVRQIPPGRWPQGSLEWLMQISNVPADPVAIPAGASVLVESGQLILFGGSMVNSATTAGTVTLYDGVDAKGTFIAQVAVPASSPFNLNIPRAGVLCEIGLFAVVAGVTLSQSALYLGHIWKYPFTPPGE